ncbi:hypothetical protein QBC40DRAFT_333395 [Triangularia verruculosa]|uniref:Uncharacterized protein n=1 Tax=Triangularia verruculosa TaxID=2587418 RepID=A0AAN6XBJ8_9PEZI|nr:hypothetical protein QBC40DRAFT_333395 [Triangularia verruculosa]
MSRFARNSRCPTPTLSSTSFASLIKRLRRSGTVDILISWRASTNNCIVSSISILKTVPKITSTGLKKALAVCCCEAKPNRACAMAGPQTTPSQKRWQHCSAGETTPNPTTTMPKGKMAGSKVMKRQSQTTMARRQKAPASGSASSPYPRQKNLGIFLAARILSDMYSGNLMNFLQVGRQEVAAKSCSESDFTVQSSPVRGNSCAFRTMLNDGASSCASLVESTFDDMGSDIIRFDDSECISIGRTPGNVPNQQQQLQKRVYSGIVLEKQGRNLYSVPADLLAPETEDHDESTRHSNSMEEDIEMAICSPIFAAEEQPPNLSVKAEDKTANVINCLPIASNNLSCPSGLDNQENSVEAVNMPFWGTPRLKKHQRFPFRDHGADYDDDDDMSIISDLSLIPSYSPTDPERQYKIKVTRAVFKRIIKSQARAASKTVRQIKRSCREAMESAFDHSAPTYKPTTCVRVGDAF